MTSEKLLSEMVEAVSVELRGRMISDRDVYIEVAKRLAAIVVASSDQEERLAECDMCGKMAIPHDSPSAA